MTQPSYQQALLNMQCKPCICHYFVEEVKALPLTLSTKGVIVAKIQKHAYALANVLAAQGIVYQVKKIPEA